MQHMTANWSPIAQETRHQLCYGVWALLGSTGAWPQTVNMWEEDGWDGLADSFANEAVGARRAGSGARAVVGQGGRVPARRVRPHRRPGAVDPHDRGAVRRRRARRRVRARARHRPARGGGRAAGAGARRRRADPLRRTAGSWPARSRPRWSNDDEALLLWAIPTWAQWGHGRASPPRRRPPRRLARRPPRHRHVVAPRAARRRAAVAVPDRAAAVPRRPHRLGGCPRWPRSLASGSAPPSSARSSADPTSASASRRRPCRTPASAARSDRGRVLEPRGGHGDRPVGGRIASRQPSPRRRLVVALLADLEAEREPTRLGS